MAAALLAGSGRQNARETRSRRLALAAHQPGDRGQKTRRPNICATDKKVGTVVLCRPAIVAQRERERMYAQFGCTKLIHQAHASACSSQ